MTDAQIFQLAGFVLFPLGLAWVLNPRAMRETFKEIAGNRGFLLLSGMFAVIVGYLLLALRSPGSSGIITFFGFVSLAKGLVIILLPSVVSNPYLVLAKLRKYFAVMPWLVLLVGAAALFMGYFA